MDQSQKIILTPFNLFEWKDEMGIFLRVNGLYKVTMATEADPNAAVEKIKWHNRRDEALWSFVYEHFKRPPLPS